MNTESNDSRFFYGGDISLNIYPADNGYEISDIALGIHTLAKNIVSNGRGIQAELDISYPYPTSLKKGIILHLQNHQERQKLALELAGICTEALPWDKILDKVCELTIEHHRQGEPALELYTYDTATPPEYLVKPLIMKDVPNIIFADQESLKTQTAILAAILTLIGNEAPKLNGFDVQIPPFTGDVLFLDWENNPNSTLWNLKKIRLGMNIEPELSVIYLSCDLPLDQNLDRIREIFKQRKIILTVIDSLGLAAGGELKDSTRATTFYAALRSLKTTSLILAHTSKSLDSKKTVFGSAYFEFLSRNIWEAQREEVDPRQHRLALHHHKSNYGKFPALGLEYTFDVDRTYIESFNAADEPTFREKMSISIRIQKELENGDYASSELADILNEKLNSVDHAVKRMSSKNLVDKLSNGKWHLRTT